MGLLDGGLAAVFGAAFGGLYLPGTLHKPTVTRGADQRITATGFADLPMRYQPEAISDEARARAGIPASSVRLIILASGLAERPSSSWEVTVAAGRFRLASVDADPAASHFIVRADKI